MRCRFAAALIVAAALPVAGCGGPAHPTPGDGVVLEVSLAPPLSRSADFAAATATLYVASIEAISDRPTGDARALASALLVDGGGDSARATLAGAPPGLYSAVSVTLGDATRDGLRLTGTHADEPVEVALRLDAVVVRCATPARLDPGGTLHLTLAADPSAWLDGVDLALASSDGDERGVLIDHEDNSALGAIVVANVARSFQLDCR